MAYPDYPSNVAYAIPLGYPFVMAQTTVFALPGGGPVIIHSSNTNIQFSPDGVVGFQTIAAVTLGATVIGSGFVRSIGSTANAICVKAR